jgi:large subunit ribosomal protein L30e
MNSGLLLLGQNQTADACAKGEAKLVILAANCPQEYVDDLSSSHPDVPIHRVMLVNRELGAACAKPFHISAICVLDPGNSDLLTLRPNLE